MSLSKFESHRRDRNPGFLCYASGDRTQKPSFLAHVKHRIARPATPFRQGLMKVLLGKAGTHMARFYELHDGLLLYRDTRSDAAGIEFFPYKQWNARTAEMRQSMIAMGFDENKMPEWFHLGVVFGQIPHSANYFVFQRHGKSPGHIFYADHDNFSPKAVARNFKDFLTMIIRDPATFLYDCGCYTRYSDGRTDTQWIPQEYIPDWKEAVDTSKYQLSP